MIDNNAFRLSVRDWIATHCPPSMRTHARGDGDNVYGGRRAAYPNPESKIWLDRLAARGWTAPTWPKEYGGAALSLDDAGVLSEELKLAGCRTALHSLGLWMLGPVLLDYGTVAQKREHLPKIARGELRWCQGYSEPDAGSDLASVRMRADDDGDAYLVTGQKLWTSHADKSDWIFCLVRTDPTAPKHAGISFLLIDLESPGIYIRTIRLISGHSPFCETFFDAVRVPKSNVVGAPNRGWEIAKALLEHERSQISRLRDESSDEADEGEALPALAKRYLGTTDGEISDAIVRADIAQAEMDFMCQRLTLRRIAESTSADGAPPPAALITKLYATELNKRRHELRVSISGFKGIGWQGDEFTPPEIARTRAWLRSRANSIEGGTSEIQRNIIAKRALGLPD